MDRHRPIVSGDRGYGCAGICKGCGTVYGTWTPGDGSYELNLDDACYRCHRRRRVKWVEITNGEWHEWLDELYQRWKR